MPDSERVTRFWLRSSDSEPTLAASIEPFFKGPHLDAETLLSSTTKPSLLTLLLPWLENDEEEVQHFWLSFCAAEDARQSLWERSDKSGLRGRDLGSFVHSVYQYPDLDSSQKVRAGEAIVKWLLEGMGQDPARFRALYVAMNGEHPLALPSRPGADYSAEAILHRIMTGKALLPIRLASQERHDAKNRVLERFAASIQGKLVLPTKKELREDEGFQDGSEAARAFRETGLAGLPEAKE